MMMQRETSVINVASLLTLINLLTQNVPRVEQLRSLNKVNTSLLILDRFSPSSNHGFQKPKSRENGQKTHRLSLELCLIKVFMDAALHVISNGEHLSLSISSLTRFSMSGSMHRLGTSRSQLITLMSGDSGGRIKRMWSSTSSWAKTTSLSTQ